uniref:vWA domain-containing protein n=1 Tax=Candidatus Limisoma sp. TaxID=3076476 RepID=UPI003FEE8483
MFSLGNPKILFLLLLIPAMFGLFLLARKARTKKLKRYGRLDVVLGQIPDASRYTPWIKIGVELLLVAVVIVILARPRAKGSSPLPSKKVQGSEIVVAMDISNSMLASSTKDADGISRLQQAKFIVEKLFDRMTNDKVGLVVFAGDAYVQMPITNDFSSAKMFLNSLSTNMVSNQGTAIGAAIETSMVLFSTNPKCQTS